MFAGCLMLVLLVRGWFAFDFWVSICAFCEFGGCFVGCVCLLFNPSFIFICIITLMFAV